MANKNWNCDGGVCRTPNGQVRVYPTGGGANLILCHACWAHENRYRFNRGRETGRRENWPQHDWAKAEVYPHTVDEPIDSEERICFGIKWFSNEEAAKAYHEQVRKAGKAYNGGYFDGKPCGREESFDRVVDGKTQYAVTD